MKRKFLKLGLPVFLLLSAAGYLFFSFYRIGDNLPVKTWTGDRSKPLVFYISGDAGFSSFTKKMGNSFQKKGFETIAMDTKKYFWIKKTPEQTSEDIGNCIENALENRPNQTVILVGFSFGADVAPFVYNLFSDNLKEKIQKVFVIGPSKSNDFEIHLNEYLGMEPKGSLPVVPQINEMKNVPVTVILSDFEYKYFPYWEIRLGSNYQMLHLSGDHHYNGNTERLVDTVVKLFPAN